MTSEIGDISREEASETLKELILLPSSNQDSKETIISLVTESLERYGFECSRRGPADAPAIVANFGNGGPLFSGHLDTVPIGSGWTHDQAELEGDFMYGRGSVDMKGGCAAMLLCARRLCEEGLPASMILTTDEETVMRGAEEAAKEECVRSAPAVVVCEPTSLKIGTREKGLLQFRITTRGRSAHAAMPEMGSNAIHRMLAIIDGLRSLICDSGDTMDKLTLNVTVIRGGYKVNVLPDSCEIEVDVRIPSGSSIDEVVSSISEKIDILEHEFTLMNRLPSVTTPEDADIVETIKRIKPDAELDTVAFATEMIRYCNENKNIISFGPGDPHKAHSPDERVDLREIVEAANVYIDICKTYGKRPQ